jgi:hypothetical protein
VPAQRQAPARGTRSSAAAGRLGCAVLSAEGTDAFLARAGRAFVRVTATRADGAGTVTGSGFLLGDRLVVTNRHWLDDPAAGRGLADPARIRVGTQTGTSAVRRIALPGSPHLDVAVLHLGEPVAPSPLRLGHGDLVRVGDRVWAPVPAGDGPPVLRDGVVDGRPSPSRDCASTGPGCGSSPPTAAGRC